MKMCCGKRAFHVGHGAADQVSGYGGGAYKEYFYRNKRCGLKMSDWYEDCGDLFCCGFSGDGS